MAFTLFQRQVLHCFRDKHRMACTLFQANIPGGLDDIVSQATLTNTANTMSKAGVRKDIKVIKREVVLRNRLHFLLMQWLKTDVLCSALTCDSRYYSYSLRSNFTLLK
jgi:hypothetical protein